jgi:hypothetical protein
VKPRKSLTFVLVVASLACGSAVADPFASPGDLSAQMSMDAEKGGGGFSTKAKVALWYGASQIIRSVNVSSVTSPIVGVYCITPAIKLNFHKIYPQVSAERSLSTGEALWAYWVDTPNSPIYCTENQLEVITEVLTGTTVQNSNQVSFSIVVQ